MSLNQLRNHLNHYKKKESRNEQSKLEIEKTTTKITNASWQAHYINTTPQSHKEQKIHHKRYLNVTGLQLFLQIEQLGLSGQTK